MVTAPKWGIVTTVKAPIKDIQNFCAHHLELGVHRIYLYLDDPEQDGQASLSDHPKIRVQTCDRTHWKRHLGHRPKKHQNRQVENARHAYERRIEVDWLCHIDVDEFLWPLTDFTGQLADLSSDCLVARIRPAEALANESPDTVTHFKRLTLNAAKRREQTQEIYPTYGGFLNGGFLSHVQGKLIYRTGINGLKAKIHNIFLDDQKNPGELELTGTELLHLHAKSWDRFLAAFHFRLEQGSYRSELKAAQNGMTMHQLFQTIYDEDGEAGLRAFYDEVCTASPALLDRLRARDLLSSHDLALDRKRSVHFAQH